MHPLNGIDGGRGRFGLGFLIPQPTFRSENLPNTRSPDASMELVLIKLSLINFFLARSRAPRLLKQTPLSAFFKSNTKSSPTYRSSCQNRAEFQR